MPAGTTGTTSGPCPVARRYRDVVDYALPLGPLGALAHALVVRRQLDAIFAYRRDRCAARFG